MGIKLSVASQTWRSWCAECIRLSTSGFPSIRLYLKNGYYHHWRNLLAPTTSITNIIWTNGSRSPRHQHQIRRSLPIRKYDVILVRLSPLKRCCLLPKLRQASAAPSSGAFVHAIPMSSVGTRLFNNNNIIFIEQNNVWIIPDIALGKQMSML